MAKYNPPVTAPAPLRDWEVGDLVKTKAPVYPQSGVVVELGSDLGARVLNTGERYKGAIESIRPRPHQSSCWELVNKEPALPPTVTPATITVDLPLPLAYLIATLQGAAPGLTVDASHPQLKGCWDALRTIGPAIEDVLPEGRTTTLAASLVSLDWWHNTVKEINKL